MATLEDLLRELTDELKRNTAATESLRKLRADAIEHVKGTAAPPAKADKDEAKPEISANPDDRKPPTDETSEADPHAELIAAIKKFLGMDDDETRRAERQAIVRKIFAHEKVCGDEKAKPSQVPVAMIPMVIKNIEKKRAEMEEAAKASASASAGDDLL